MTDRDIPEEAKENLRQLQIAEQSLQKSLAQKQGFQSQLAETESALEEVKGRKHAYRIIGNIMVEADAKTLTEELRRKHELLELRIKTLIKQEDRIREKTQSLQKDVMKEMQGATNKHTHSNQ